MSKHNRESVPIGCSALLLVASYWASIISSICGGITIFVVASIVYAISYIVLFEIYTYGRKANWRKRLIRISFAEAVQLMPCIVILVMR